MQPGPTAELALSTQRRLSVDMTVTLSTPRLVLITPQVTDLESWAELDADVEATRFIGGVATRGQSFEGLRTAIEMWSRKGCGLFSVFESKTSRWIGRTGPWVPDGALGTEIGWAFATSAQGHGYATEAARAAMDWAFQSLEWFEAIHCIGTDNAASVAVAHRLGSRWLRSDVESDGKPVEIYGQTRSEWLAAPR
jgi:RimJ/RimL family protein N-acetyltransferase